MAADMILTNLMTADRKGTDVNIAQRNVLLTALRPLRNTNLQTRS
jgi:hypothetical protein